MSFISCNNISNKINLGEILLYYFACFLYNDVDDKYFMCYIKESQVMDMNDKNFLAGQVMMVGFSGVDDISEDFISFIEEYKVGNVILFSENIYSKEQLKRLCDKIQKVGRTYNCKRTKDVRGEF